MGRNESICDNFWEPCFCFASMVFIFLSTNTVGFILLDHFFLIPAVSFLFIISLQQELIGWLYFILAIVDMLLLLSLTLSNFTSGVFLEKFGFVNAFYLILCTAVASLFVAVFFFEESLPKEKRTKRTNFLCLPRKVIQIISLSRPGRWRLGYLLSTFIVMVLVSPAVIMGVMMLYLLNLPFCWSSKKIGYYRGTYFAALGIGGAIGVKILPKFFSRSFVIIISILSSVGLLLVFGFSKSTYGVYLGMHDKLYLDLRRR